VLVLEDQGKTQEARVSLRQALDACGPRPEFRDLIRELGAEK
jgi:hypothetical protein